MLLIASILLGVAAAQQIGTNNPEVHPQLTTYKCAKGSGCTAQNTSVVIDAGYRWIHTVGGYTSCTTASGLDPAICTNATACGKSCALEGTNYTSSGVSTSAGTLTLNMYVGSNGASPRVYLLSPDGKNYEDLRLVGQEIAFDVDVSKLPCGMNGALYLSEMSMSGGRSANNPAGATMGTGYCDAQCPVSNFINGEMNTNSSGACCAEMDLWEANSAATAFTPHSCNTTGVYACSGAACSGTGVCDKGGCGFNAYSQGAKNFYAKGGTVDTSKPFTVVTQFMNDTTGALREIRRLYVQNGKVIQNAKVASGNGNSITDALCGKNDFERLGGLKGMGKSMQRGMVLIFSIWNDAGGFMKWLDSGNNGPCAASEGDPATIKEKYHDTSVTWSNIKWGEIGSTYASS